MLFLAVSPSASLFNALALIFFLLNSLEFSPFLSFKTKNQDISANLLAAQIKHSHSSPQVHHCYRNIVNHSCEFSVC